MSAVRLTHDWYPDPLPANVTIGERSWLHSSYAFLHCRARPGAVKIGRDWYAITHFALKDGACAHCGHPLPGRFGAAPVALRSGFRRLRVSI